MADYFSCYVNNPLVERNSFINMPREQAPLPTFATARAALPQPHWDGHQDAIDCYWRTWELGFRNLRQPLEGTGFVANYIDTAFNDCLFMWDSAFITMFARYGWRGFNFQRTLDNLYSRQHPDGFICREIREKDGTDCHHRHDPGSTGPNVLPWAEWEYFLNFGDRQRLAAVFPVLHAYHQWLAAYRTWPDGTYWTCGWGCGMDNQPRMPAHMNQAHYHGHMSWIDACLQQVLSARLLVAMAETLGDSGPGGERDVAGLRAELARLGEFINERMWNEPQAFYVDRRADGSLSDVKSIGAYWALLAGIVPPQRLEAFVAHLSNEREFNRPHRVPSLSADHPEYKVHGGYWLGAVWAPTNYMVLRGLTRAGHDSLAHEIAANHLQNVVAVYKATSTLWENYSSEKVAPGDPAKADFVGWTGLPAVAVMLEYVFGLRPSGSDRPTCANPTWENRLTWDVRLTEAHGVRQYPFGRDGLLDLRCPARKSPTDRPAVEVKSNVPLTLELKWAGGNETVAVRP